MNRKKAKLLFILAALITLLYIPSQTVGAASKKSQALKAYRTFLSRKTISWGSNSSTRVSLKKCRFALAYIDKDSVPELILCSGSNRNSHADGYYLLYTYKNGKVTYADNLMDDFFYYKKKGVYASIHSGTGGYESFYYKLSGAKPVYKLYTQDEAGWDYNGDGKIGINYKKVAKLKSPSYLSAMKTLSRSAFQKQLKKLVGSSKKATVKKYYANTAANRRKYLK